MKKCFKAVITAAMATVLALSLTACFGNNYKEVAGTYELLSITGTVNGVSVSTANYEYYRLILDEKGNATVQSKPAGVGAKYEAKGTYKYSDNKIELTTKSGAASVTEEFTVEGDVITYVVDSQGMSFTLKLKKQAESAE